MHNEEMAGKMIELRVMGGIVPGHISVTRVDTGASELRKTSLFGPICETLQECPQLVVSFLYMILI